jgi:hypothetical protein
LRCRATGLLLGVLVKSLLLLLQTPLEFFSKKLGETNEQVVRSYVGRFGVTGEHQTSKCV